MGVPHNCYSPPRGKAVASRQWRGGLPGPQWPLPVMWALGVLPPSVTPSAMCFLPSVQGRATNQHLVQAPELPDRRGEGSLSHTHTPQVLPGAGVGGVADASQNRRLAGVESGCLSSGTAREGKDPETGPGVCQSRRGSGGTCGGTWRRRSLFPALCPALKFTSVTTLFPQFPYLAKE